MDVSLDDPPEPAGAGDVRSQREFRGYLGRGGSILHAGLMAGAREGLVGQPGGDVHQRPRNARDWNAADDCATAGIEEAAPVGLHSFNASFSPRRHLRRRRPSLDEPVQIRGCEATETGALSSRQDRGEVGRLGHGRPVPHSVHTSVLSKQAAACHAHPDLARRHARIDELVSGDQAMLALRDSCEYALDDPDFGTHTVP